ncbi:MAG: hypothetical protein BWY84_00459 [Candidatus Aerophobetes bacterium ADurb.Bin490]|nr:MAG: hypothetical protein BWY84_00459 [Candidatus Aerophobetes bacterium ADurb.Bin490]
METLRTTGANAGMENFLSEFNIPRNKAAMLTKSINGKSHRVSDTVS